MSTRLFPSQVTGNLSKNYQDMLFAKSNSKNQSKTVFGEGYFNLQSPAKTFKTRNHSLITESTTRKQPMLVKKHLKLTNGYNYSTRKFHLQSDKFIDRFLPTNPSSANIMFQANGSQIAPQESSEINQSTVHLNVQLQRGLGHKRLSLPPPLRPTGLDESLPELNATKAKIEQHIYKTPLKRNVSILISRNQNNGTALTTKTPSYMKENDINRNASGFSINIHAELDDKKNGEHGEEKFLPPLSKSSYKQFLESDNALVGKFAIKSKLFELQAHHRRPQELLQEKLIDKAVENNTSHLRAGTDLNCLRKLSLATSKQRLEILDDQPERLRVIYSPKATGIPSPLTSDFGSVAIRAGLNLSPKLRRSKLAVAKEDQNGLKSWERDGEAPSDEQLSTMLNGTRATKVSEPINKDIGFLEQLQQKTIGPFHNNNPGSSQYHNKNRHAKRNKSKKHHETVTHVPSPRFSSKQHDDNKVESRLMSTQQNTFMDTQRIPFRRTSKLSSNHSPSGEIDPANDPQQLVVKGSSGQLSLDGSNSAQIQKNERDAFKDFSRTVQSNLGIKLDPNEDPKMKTNINIKDIDFGKQRAKLKITTSREKDSNDDIISKDSQANNEDEDYYEEMQLRSKLKPKRRNDKKAKEIDDNVETEGPSALELQSKTISSLSKSPRKRMKSPNFNFESKMSILPTLQLKKQVSLAQDQQEFLTKSPTEMRGQRGRLRSNRFMQESNSKGTLTIMNVTFCEGKPSQEEQKGDALKKRPYGSNAFHQSQKRRFEKIQKQNEDMKEMVSAEYSPRMKDSDSRRSFTGAKLIIQKATGSFSSQSNFNVHANTSLTSKMLMNTQQRVSNDRTVKKKMTEDISSKIKPIKISLKPVEENSKSPPRADTQLKVRGKEAHLEIRPSSKQFDVVNQEQVQVKIFMQTKPALDSTLIMNKTAERLMMNNGERVSNHTVDNVADDLTRALEQEDIDELDSPDKLRISQPKMNHYSPLNDMRDKPNTSSKQKLSPVGSRQKLNKKQSSFVKHKRKSALEKTNGGVEPWGNKDKVYRQQSVLSFAKLEGDTDDDDRGPVLMKERDSVEFLLQKDNSVQKIAVEDDLNLRSSFATGQVVQQSPPHSTINVSQLDVSNMNSTAIIPEQNQEDK